jgi:hypothetical protein
MSDFITGLPYTTVYSSLDHELDALEDDIELSTNPVDIFDKRVLAAVIRRYQRMIDETKSLPDSQYKED